MIAELSNYISIISEQFPLKDFITPTEGLHIMLEVKEGEVHFYKSELYLPIKGKEEEYSDFIRNECLPREFHIDYINSDKAIADKKIHSASPFALKIRMKSFDEEWEKWVPDFKKKTESIKKEIKKLSKELDKALQQLASEENQNSNKYKRLNNKLTSSQKKLDNTELELKKSDEEAEQTCTLVAEAHKWGKNINKLKGDEKKIEAEVLLSHRLDIIKRYLRSVIEDYFETSEEKCLTNYLNNSEKEEVRLFQNYCAKNIYMLLQHLAKDVLQLKKEENIIILLKNVPPERYEEENKKYFTDNIFNVDTYNMKIEEEKYGLSGYLNNAANKKQYLKHLSAPFDINFRIPQIQALLLNTFETYRRAGAFKTNPLIVFIDKKELNNEVISVIKREGAQISFQHLMRTLFENKEEDLGNYYLFYFLGSEIKDVDFISSFSFELDVKIKEVIPFTQPEQDKKIKNIFQFELEIVQALFNNQLVKRKNESFSFRYFDEIDNNPKYITDTEWQLLMRYRKAFYDFVYKSRRQIVTNTAFHDIVWQIIVDDIKHDEIQNEQHTKTNAIRRKLNIWFSLWDFFNGTQTQNNLTMANRITDHQDRLRIVRDNPNEHIQKDDEFAFTVGQVIYYLLTKSKSANLTHAALEPFLQKTDAGELKKAIANTFNAYKHEIEFGQGRFEKFCSEVMDYEVNGNFKELMPFLLAGYFSISLIYEKSQTK